MIPEAEINPQLKPWFQALETVPMRNPQRLADGQAAFLAAARQMAQSAPPPPAAPRPAILRWRPAFALSVLAVLLLMVLAGAGATLAAQSSLPGEALYGLKLWTEETRLALTGDPWEAWRLSLDYTQRRVNEALALGDDNRPLPARLYRQTLEQADHSIRLALALPVDAQVQERLLQQTRLRLISMVAWLEAYTAQPGAHQIGALTQLRLELQERVNWIDDGMQEPNRLRHRLGIEPQAEPSSATHTPTPCPTCTPGPHGTPSATKPAPTRTPSAPKSTIKAGGPQSTPQPQATGSPSGPNPTSGTGGPQSTPQPGPTGEPSGPNPTSGSGGPQSTPQPGPTGDPGGPHPTSGSGGPQSTPQPGPTGDPGKP